MYQFGLLFVCIVYFVFGRHSIILSTNSSPLNNGKPRFRTFVGNNTKICILRIIKIFILFQVGIN